MSNFESEIFKKNVLIFGLGRQGGGSGDKEWLQRHGAVVRVSDQDTTLVKEGQTKEQIDWADIIIKNPGVSDQNELILYAKKLNKSVYTSIALFVKYANIKTIGVTGTRGKSTTVALIKAVLESAYPGQVIAGGNIAGTSGLELFDQLANKKYAVLELSSFQLHNFHELAVSPDIAVVTNLYPDHLNRYSSIKEYLKDKQAICQYQDVGDYCLYNVDNAGALQISSVTLATKIPYSAKSSQDFVTKLRGNHNKENIAACQSVAKLLGVNEKIVKESVSNFPGLASRLETIRINNSVSYINDTTSTTPVAAIKALQSMTSPTIWITGGDTKNLPFKELVKEVSQNSYLKNIVVLGSKNIPDYLKELSEVAKNKILGQVFTMSEAVELATKNATAGDNVLLSPGFASFDLFKNEFDRGRQFNDLVSAL